MLWLNNGDEMKVHEIEIYRQLPKMDLWGGSVDLDIEKNCALFERKFGYKPQECWVIGKDKFFRVERRKDGIYSET